MKRLHLSLTPMQRRVLVSALVDANEYRRQLARGRKLSDGLARGLYKDIRRADHLKAQLLALTAGLVLACLGCMKHGKGPAPDGSDPDAHHDVSPIGDVPPTPDAYVCTPWTPPSGTGCCVFAGTCTGGAACYFIATQDPPSQATGTCYTPGALPEGGACYFNNGTGQCGAGLYCAWNNGQIMPSGSGAGLGTCRTICDPTNTAVNGCPIGKTCVGMPVCGPTDNFPDCPSDPMANVGYCL